jgi:alkylation response protein AidB-like acyl-CoA dehydrogenase
MTTIEERPVTVRRSQSDWLELIHELGSDFATRAAEHDEADSFVSENYNALKRHRFFSAMVPKEFGGGGVSHSEMCGILRTLAQYCSSTALAHSMHQHLVATTLWKFNHGQGGEPMLRNVASNQPVLVSTGANDWLESSGEAVRVEGGYRVTATKAFASQSAVGDVLVTSAPFNDTEKGWQVLHFPVPMNSEGVTVLNDWHTLGMRATGSHSVKLTDVFVPETSVNLRRPRGVFHPVFNVSSAIAIPLIISVYMRIARKAAQIAVEAVKKKKRPKPHQAVAIGAMMNELTSAELHWNDMIRITNDLDFQPVNQIGQDILSRKTNSANACIGVVTKAMEIAGGQGFSRGFGLERLFRDVQAAKYHPLPQADQQQSFGEYLLGVSNGHAAHAQAD